MKNLIFRGIATAMVTPMTATGVDYDALARFIDFQLEEGINALVAVGTTGESATLTPQERKEVIRFTVERVAGRVPSLPEPAPTTPNTFWNSPRAPATTAPTPCW